MKHHKKISVDPCKTLSRYFQLTIRKDQLIYWITTRRGPFKIYSDMPLNFKFNHRITLAEHFFTPQSFQFDLTCQNQSRLTRVSC